MSYGNTVVIKDWPSMGTIDFVDPDIGLTRVGGKYVCRAGTPLRVTVTDAFPTQRS